MSLNLFIVERWGDLEESRMTLRDPEGESIIGILDSAGAASNQFDGHVCLLTTLIPGGGDALARITRHLREWSNRKVVDSRTIKATLAYGTLSLWWFVDSWLVQNAYFTPDLSMISEMGEVIAEWLSQHKPDRVFSLCRTGWVNEVISMVCADASVPYVFLSRQRSAEWIASISRSVLVMLKLLRIPAIWVTYRIHDAFWRLSKNSWPNRPRVLVFSGDQWQRVFDPVEKKAVYGDLHFSGIISALRDKYSFAFVTYITPRRIVLKQIGQKQAQRQHGWPLSYCPFYSYMTWRAFKASWNAFVRLRGAWKKLSMQSVWKHFGHTWTSLELKKRLQFYSTRVLLEHLMDIETAKEIIRRERPQLVVVVGETRSEARALLMAARAVNIPTLALQHGRFADYYYSLTEQDKSKDPIHGFPLPDKFALYGDFYRDYLRGKLNVPEGILRVTGAPRWDFIAYPQTLPERSLTMTHLGLKDDLPTVLFGTNELLEMPLVTEMVRSTLAPLPRTQLIVKLHPAERNVWKYRSIFSKVRIERMVLVTGGDLYELLACCDVVITPVSTLIIDASIMRKPVILADPLRLNRSSLFGRHPSILVAQTTEEMRNHLNEITNCSASDEDIRASQRDFVELHAYKLDGRAHLRVVDVMEELLAGSRCRHEDRQ